MCEEERWWKRGLKAGHLILLFLGLYVACFLSLSVEQHQYDAAMAEKVKMEQSLKLAAEQTAKKLIAVMKEPIEVQAKVVENAFFESMYATLGILEDKEKQEELKNYVPALVLLTEDGMMLYHAWEMKKNGIFIAEYSWSDCVMFDGIEECSEVRKREIMIEYMEKKVSEVISNHNFIASQFGLSYKFHVPAFFENISEKLHVPMVIAVFQGWPLNSAGTIFYENCIDAGVYIQEVRKYVVEVSNSIVDTYSYFHEKSCEIVKNGTGRFLPEMLSRHEAVVQYGALPCRFCME